jgi:hypothetical protein
VEHLKQKIDFLSVLAIILLLKNQFPIVLFCICLVAHSSLDYGTTIAGFVDNLQNAPKD